MTFNMTHLRLHCHCIFRQFMHVHTLCKGRRQNTSVATGDFLQKIVKCMLVEFVRSVTPSPHVRVKGHLSDDSQLLLSFTW